MRKAEHHRWRGRDFFTTLISLVVVSVFILTPAFVLSDDSPSIAQYTAFPPFGGRPVKPNVLVNLDTSTSLGYFAYDFDYNAWTAASGKGGGKAVPPPSSGYSSNTRYYGYFDPDERYSYNGTEFVADPTGPWNGNFLNWLTMRRADVIKKALIGGKTKYRVGMITDPSDAHANDLVGEPPYHNSYYLGYQKEVDLATAMANTSYSGTDDPVVFTFDNDEGWKGGMGRKWWDIADVPSFSFGNTFNSSASYKVVVHLDTEPEGIIQRVGESVRWGLEVMNDGYYTTESQMGPYGGNPHFGKDEAGGSKKGGGPKWGGIVDIAGGTVLVPVGYNKVDEMVAEIAEAAPYTPATPIAESIWTATGYFEQYEPLSLNGPRYYAAATNRGRWGRKKQWGYRPTAESYPVGQDVDPYNYALDPAAEENLVGCGESFVITITDGEPTADSNVDTTALGSAFNTLYTDGTARLPGWEGTDYFWLSDLGGSHYVDEVAYFGHADAAAGSYRDLRDGSPGTGTIITVDIDGDSKEDMPQKLNHYFIYANFGGGTPDGRRLLNWSEGWTGGGGGAARNGAFQDSNGNYEPDLTSEYNADGDSADDTYFEAETGYEIEAALMSAIFNIFKRTSPASATAIAGSSGSGDGTVYKAYFYPARDFDIGGVTFQRRWLGYLEAWKVDAEGNLGSAPLWEAGELLWQKSPADRVIYTTIDGKNIYKYDPLNFLSTDSFVAGNAYDLKTYLGAVDNTEAMKIIDYIRGVDQPGYRQRTIDNTASTWKLGDIIYSTPTPVSAPAEEYDRLYRDSSYAEFYRTYKNRRPVVYVGANDGMLHAFDGGTGEELWAFIPRDLLPHLKWLTYKNYSHVYYVDLKPKVTDAQIFTPGSVHPGGWGTILIGGMRLGGKEISTEAGTFRSAYFALDITDPETPPKLLWTFTDPGLGLTTSYPAVARVKDPDDTDGDGILDRWVMIVGSGPTDFDAVSNVNSSSTGKVFIVDLKTGGLLKTFDTGVDNAFMAAPVTVDVNLDYRVDVAYVGASSAGTIGAINSFNGSVYRIVTKNSTNPADWVMSTLFTLPGNNPVTSPPSVALDRSGRLWVYFGAGKFIGADDKLNTDMQSFYGIKDVCKAWVSPYDCTSAGAVTLANLLDVTNATIVDDDIADAVVTGVSLAKDSSCTGADITWCDLLSTMKNKDGWYIDFTTPGERTFTKPIVIGGLVVFSSYVPQSDLCSEDEGTGKLWTVYYETGTAYKDYVLKTQIASPPADKVIERVQDLPGGGSPNASAMITTDGLKAFAQTSLGDIPGTGIEAPFSLQSGIAGWQTGFCRQ